jgi:hypothetical protein
MRRASPRRLVSILAIPIALLAMRADSIAAASRADATLSDQAEAPSPPGKPFAVVELFTSQGCSSCPPADGLLADIATRADREQLPIYVLSFHVDYWNQLGWSDPYSSAEFSARQQEYEKALGGGVYTPQVVVNGIWEGVGSRERELGASIERVLHKKPGVILSLAVEREGSDLIVRPEVRGSTGGETLWLAITDRTAKNHVDRGENAGNDSSHVHVVRVLVETSAERTTRLRVPEALAGRDASLTGLLQRDRSGEIVAAARVELQRTSDSPEGTSGH